MSVVEKLQWRYATKKFDTSKKVSADDMQELLECVRLSPSSYGLQPWKFIIVEDPETRATLRAAAYDQPQVTDASFLVVVCAKSDMDDAYVERYTRAIEETQGLEVGKLAELEQSMKESVNGKDLVSRKSWMARQAYLALGVLVTSCAVKDIDACPMEGFDKGKFDEILELDKLGVNSYALCAVGYRAEDDRAATRKKVRWSMDEVIVRR